ncbi:hypothetical protein LS73_003830 [Helicobacter muridarum]|uniref:Rod shape-determining protein MreD n=1 Tax=Helicobacter muridarum TaxID=216 RepID=A0A377PUI0_9HELI|nr:hypothetical protein [Helicobacter muridarum]TLE00788.1 hypothetical protein LS73_003830 [Helicobacter muridarum]STQ86526.1 Uncharacterised protein [Helicobacter muridarum]
MHKRKQIKSFILALLAVGFYVFYTSMSDIYPLLPPLIGILFTLFNKYSNDKQLYVPLLVLLCLAFYELDKSLIFGIMPIVFCFTYFFISRRLESILSGNLSFMVLYIGILYLLYCGGIILCNILFNIPMLQFSFIFIYYLLADCIGTAIYCYFVLKE